MRSIIPLAFIGAVSILSPGPLAAQETEENEEPAVRSAADAEADLEEARAAFRTGNAHYAAGRYELAAELFVRAYELSGRPELLFNLANTYERAGDYETAADYLRRYLESGKVHDLVSVRERLQRLELAIARRSAPDRETEQPGAVPARAPVRPAEDRSRAPSRVPYALAAGGAIGGVAVAVTFGLLADGERGEIDSLCSERGSELICPPEAGGHLDRERRFALASDVGTGVAALSAGAALVYFIATRGDERPATATPIVFGERGFGVAATARF